MARRRIRFVEGERVGKLTILSASAVACFAATRLMCLCDCGRITYKTESHIYASRNTRISCGCSGPAPKPCIPYRCSSEGCVRPSKSKGHRGLCHYCANKKSREKFARTGVTARAVCAVEGCERISAAKGFCVTHYKRMRKWGSTDAPIKPLTDGQLFIRDAARSVSDDCIFWPYGDNGHGYGVVYHEGKQQKAHRVALMIATGISPEPGVEACHSCDNPGCVNPAHLRWGTHGENMLDMIIRGRTASPRHRREPRNSGRRGGHPPKLSESLVKEMRALPISVKSTREYVHETGASRGAVAQARAGSTWKWVRLSNEEFEEINAKFGTPMYDLERSRQHLVDMGLLE